MSRNGHEESLKDILVYEQNLFQKNKSENANHSRGLNMNASYLARNSTHHSEPLFHLKFVKKNKEMFTMPFYS